MQAWRGCIAPGQVRKSTSADRWDYTVAELRQIEADHDLPATSRMTHDGLVALIAAADISLPPKPAERMPPFRRRTGPLAEGDLHPREARSPAGRASACPVSGQLTG
jgi:hypothetical protein